MSFIPLLYATCASAMISFKRKIVALRFICNQFFCCCYCRSADNKFYYGLATEKQEAAEQFEARQEAGENVGLVEARYRKVVHAIGVNIYTLCLDKQTYLNWVSVI